MQFDRIEQEEMVDVNRNRVGNGMNVPFGAPSPARRGPTPSRAGPLQFEISIAGFSSLGPFSNGPQPSLSQASWPGSARPSTSLPATSGGFRAVSLGFSRVDAA
jgi:hypothetical protein